MRRRLLAGLMAAAILGSGGVFGGGILVGLDEGVVLTGVPYVFEGSLTLAASSAGRDTRPDDGAIQFDQFGTFESAYRQRPDAEGAFDVSDGDTRYEIEPDPPSEAGLVAFLLQELAGAYTDRFGTLVEPADLTVDEVTYQGGGRTRRPNRIRHGDVLRIRGTANIGGQVRDFRASAKGKYAGFALLGAN